ncbi:MAG: peptide chain release factor N(5)-glutamine methyltransferase [Bacteroidales bacterium]|nr:peptide chain release factor N(5)-glutamine methyltransferase [Bacteroidales bacterium]
MRPLRQIREEFRNILSPHYGTEEADALFYWAAQEILHQDRMRLVANLSESVSESQVESLSRTLARLQEGEPVQYIFRKAYFLDLELEVNPSVLIPRGETEELVLWALESLRSVTNPTVLDLCTGSGAIALALAKARPDAAVWACDISPDALQMARRNNEKCGTDVHFFQQDILQESLSENIRHQNFDLIVSNPPYVRHSEKNAMRANVLQYEPHTALFVEDADPLLFYRRIAALAQERLRVGGQVLVEINEAFPEECKALFSASGFTQVEVRQDLHGKPRMLGGSKIKSKS